MVLDWITSLKHSPVRLVEGTRHKIHLASSFHKPNLEGQIWARCINPGNEPWELRSGKTIGKYTAVDDQDVVSIEVHVLNDAAAPREARQEDLRVPPHLEEVLSQVAKQCEGPEQVAQFARLLIQYTDVFSRGEGDVGKTELIRHSIPVKPDTKLIWMPAHRFGPHKQLEAERQVQALLEQGWIEPAGGAWSSPVLLVKKNDSGSSEWITGN